jgi:hypothetical protein
MAGEPVPLSELARDLPEPVGGWAAELERRFIPLVEDDLGRPAVERVAARALFTEHRQQQEAAAVKRAELERQAVADDEQRRASLPSGIPAGSLPEGVSAGLAMMLADPMQGPPRRQSVLEHALENPAGALVYHPIRDEAS